MEPPASRSKFTVAHLKATAAEIAQIYPPDFPRPLPPGLFLFGASMGVLRHFFDVGKFDSLVNPNLRKPDFLTPSGASSAEHIIAMQRVTDFAEALFNLQWIEGFEHALAEFSAPTFR